MSRPLRIEYAGAVYHITARGNERGEIFTDNHDRQRFIGMLIDNLDMYKVRLYAYVLMGNHYHLLIETRNANLSVFMHALQSHYTNYFNNRHDRVGHLFQGRYKAIMVDKDGYLLELSRYIHLNPVRAGLTRRPGEWKWGSYDEYVSKQTGCKWVESETVLRYFGRSRGEAARKYINYIKEGMEEDGASPFDAIKGQIVLGDEDFFNKIKNKYATDKPYAKTDLPAARLLGRWGEKDAEKALAAVAKRFNVEPKSLLATHQKGNNPRIIAIFLFRKLSGWTINKIGSYFGISYSAVTKILTRNDKLLSGNTEVKQTLEAISVQIKA